MPTSIALSLDQMLLLGLLAGMLIVFAIDRFRIEVVALAGLGLAAIIGLVAPEKIFAGFANPAVVTVVEILLIIQVLGRARILETTARRVAAAGYGETRLILGLCAVSALLSAFMNNIGAFALMLPAVTTLADASGMSLKRLLLPVSYATLMGGMCSLIGTPANLLVSQALVAAGDAPIGFFAFAVAGLPVTLVGLALAVFWVPRHFDDDDLSSEARNERTVVTEITVPPASPLCTLALPDLARDHGITCHGVIRDGRRVFARPDDIAIAAGDLLVATADLAALDRLIAAGDIAAPDPMEARPVSRAEIVIMPESTLVGSRIGTIELFGALGLRVVALSTRFPRIEGRLADIQLGVGDVLVLEGERLALGEVARETETLTLTPSPPAPAPVASPLPPAAFIAGIVLAATGLLSPELAFGLVLLVLVVAREINLRSALADLNWPIILMLGALIPLGSAVETTGAGAALAGALLSLLPATPFFLLGATLFLAVAITPFVNNASTAIVLAPIALELARAAGLPPEPFLIAIAVGASTDFITPVGHHNNTLAMTIGNYRFSDFVRCGWPLTLASVLIGGGALTLFWLG